MLDILKKRRSIRKFKNTALTCEQEKMLLKSGLLAPTSRNRRPLEFYAVNNRELILKLKDCKVSGTTALETAPFAIIVIADENKSDVWVEDAAIASICIQLTAESMGLGSNWIQLRKRTSVFEESSEKAVKKLLNLEENYRVLSIIAIGIKDEEKEPYKDEDLDFSKVHYAVLP